LTKVTKRNIHNQQSEVSSVHAQLLSHAIKAGIEDTYSVPDKADKKRKLKLKISNA